MAYDGVGKPDLPSLTIKFSTTWDTMEGWLHSVILNNPHISLIVSIHPPDDIGTWVHNWLFNGKPQKHIVES